MSSDSPYYLDVVAGNALSGASVIHKFGRNIAVGTTFAAVSIGGIYRMPQVAGATTLRIKAGDVADTAAGSGAQSVTLEGLDATGAFIAETLATAGTSASSSTSNSFLRLTRAFVLSSGTYSLDGTGSHADDIVIENTAGTETWATIDATDFPRSQTEIGLYTVPLGKTAYIQSIHYAVDTTKTTSLLIMQREHILETSTPYEAMRQLLVLSGVAASGVHEYRMPLGPFQELTDINVKARVSATTSEISVSFEILLRDKE